MGLARRRFLALPVVVDGGDFVDNILRWGLFTGVTPISMVQADQFEIKKTYH